MFKRIAVILAVAFVVSGCASIPTSSPVHYGSAINDDNPNSFVRVIARPPVDDMNPEAIVRGFLDACADSSSNYSIARQYLSISAAQKWNPNKGFSIYDSSAIRVTGEEAQLSFSAPSLGTISEGGYYSVGAVSQDVRAQFSLSQNPNGQWRISQVADGVLLSRADMERNLRAYSIYFFNREKTRLIPDTIMMPVTSTGIATSLVQSLIAGPSKAIAPAVHNAIPTTAKLTYGSVPVAGQVATVDFTPDVLNMDVKERKQMAAQLVWTLSSLPDVGSVRISVSGQMLAINDMNSTQTVSDWKEYSPLGPEDKTGLRLLLNNAVYTTAADGTQTRIARSAGDFTGALSQAVVSRDGEVVAAVDSTATRILLNATDPKTLTEVYAGRAVSRPSWDDQGNVYLADYGKGIQVSHLGDKWRQVTLQGNLLGDVANVRRITIAPDGVRVLLVLSMPNVDVLGMGYILRDGNDVRIVGLHRIAPDVLSVLDAVWNSPTVVTVLGSTGEGGEKLITVSLADNKLTSSLAPTGAVGLAIDGPNELVVNTIEGTHSNVYHQVASTWTLLTSGAYGFYRG